MSSIINAEVGDFFDPVIHGRKKIDAKLLVNNVIMMNIYSTPAEPIWLIKLLRMSFIKHDIFVKFILTSSSLDAVGPLTVE